MAPGGGRLLDGMRKRDNDEGGRVCCLVQPVGRRLDHRPISTPPNLSVPLPSATLLSAGN